MYLDFGSVLIIKVSLTKCLDYVVSTLTGSGLSYGFTFGTSYFFRHSMSPLCEIYYADIVCLVIFP